MKIKTISYTKDNLCIITDDQRILQSYGQTIAVVTKDKVFLDKDKWNFSKTTNKYRNIFLEEDTATTKSKIENGQYTLIDLN